MKTTSISISKGEAILNRLCDLDRLAEISQHQADYEKNIDHRLALLAAAREAKENADELRKELQLNPFVGCPVTVCYYSDLRAGRITEIKGKRFKVTELEYSEKESDEEGYCKVSDKLGVRMLGEYSPRKNGFCYQVGSEAKQGNVRCILGFAITKIDPHR